MSALRFDMDKFEKQQHIVEGFLYDVLSMRIVMS